MFCIVMLSEEEKRLLTWKCFLSQELKGVEKNKLLSENIVTVERLNVATNKIDILYIQWGIIRIAIMDK